MRKKKVTDAEVVAAVHRGLQDPEKYKELAIETVQLLKGAPKEILEILTEHSDARDWRTRVFHIPNVPISERAIRNAWDDLRDASIDISDDAIGNLHYHFEDGSILVGWPGSQGAAYQAFAGERQFEEFLHWVFDTVKKQQYSKARHHVLHCEKCTNAVNWEKKVVHEAQMCDEGRAFGGIWQAAKDILDGVEVAA